MSIGATWRNPCSHDLRVDAYDHVQHLELAYFEDQSTGGLMAVLNDDINQLERFLDVGASDVGSNSHHRSGHRRDFLCGGAERGMDGCNTHAYHHLGFIAFSEAAGATLR